MIKDEECWINFMYHMREVWANPMAVAQREAEERSKLLGELFHQYFFSKLKVLSSAFPETLQAMHISRIRAKFNDAQADRYIRERNNIIVFGEECCEYDKHIKLHPRAYIHRSFQYLYTSVPTLSQPQMGHSQSSRRLLTLPSKPRDGAKTETAKAYKTRIEARAKSIAERVNPTTNKRARYFLCRDGTIKFIERPCKLYSKIGKKDEWHFSVEYTNRQGITTLILSTASCDSKDKHLLRVYETPYITNPMSYVFNFSTPDVLTSDKPGKL